MFNSHSSRLFLIITVIVETSLLLTGVMVIGAPADVSAETLAYQSLTDGIIEGQTFESAPVPEAQAEPQYDTPPEATDEQVAARDAMQARIDAAWAARTENTNDGSLHSVAGPVPGEETGGTRPQASLPAEADPQLPGTFTQFQYATPAPASSSRISEPATSAIGKQVMYTGNWYAAESQDGGATWFYYNPYTALPDFCCDQDTVADASRNMFVWSLEGNYNDTGNGGPANQNRLLMRTADLSTPFVCTYVLQPTNLNAGYTSQWFDYPKLSTTDRYLYITANMYNGSNVWLRMVLIRYSLDDLDACVATVPTYWTSTTGWSWGAVQGGRDTAWLGDTYSSTGTFRIYGQNQATSTLVFADRAIPAWTFTNKNGTCLTPNGWNFCSRADQRITGGYLINGRLGFFWNVKQGGGFTYPYINNAEFQVGTGLVYTARRYVVSSIYAWQYGAAADNDRKYVGAAFIAAGPTWWPESAVSIWDDYTSAPPGWTIWWLNYNTWGGHGAGDYLTVRKYLPGGNLWVAATYYDNAGTYQPEFTVFGRGRDTDAWNYWKTK